MTTTHFAYTAAYTHDFKETLAVFEWDQEKTQNNPLAHGLCFEDAPLVLSVPCCTFEDTRRDYGEQRFITFGLLAERLVVVAHTPRGEKTRIISMRKGNGRETQAYQEQFKQA